MEESAVTRGRNEAVLGSTPGLSHLWVLRLLDRTGLASWLLGLGSLIFLTTLAVVLLIINRYPDPDTYRNSFFFAAVTSFFLVVFFAMGRGWHQDVIRFLEFDAGLEPSLLIREPARLVVFGELVLAAVAATILVQSFPALDVFWERGIFMGIWLFYFVQYVMIVLSLDVVTRQLVGLKYVARQIRVDLLNADFYSVLANAMVRSVGLCIAGVCIITLSYIAYTADDELTTLEMMALLMPWYLSGLVVVSLYLLPFNEFRKRIRFLKHRELAAVNAALHGDEQALSISLLEGEPVPSKIDLLYYQERIRQIREWPFTDRIRALVLFGILPPLTWVIAALIEIFLEGIL